EKGIMNGLHAKKETTFVGLGSDVHNVRFFQERLFLPHPSPRVMPVIPTQLSHYCKLICLNTEARRVEGNPIACIKWGAINAAAALEENSRRRQWWRFVDT